MSTSLAGVIKKIERANHHFNGLLTPIDTFLKANTRKVVFDYDEQTKQFWTLVDIPRDPPMEWAVIVGDILHNLRSGLDYLAWILVIAAGGTPNEYTEFPVYWDKPIPKGKVEVFPVPAQAIIKKLQPYARWPHHFKGHPLYMLHKMNIRDKHQLLNLAFVVFRFPTLQKVEIDSAGNVIGTTHIYTPSPDVLRKRALRGRIRFSSKYPRTTPNVQVHGEFSFQVKFDESGPGQGRYVIPCMKQLVNFTERVVRLLTPFA